MIRDRAASHDGWFWGWYGFGPNSGWAPDWPPGPGNGLANMGFAQYCLNCHASARDNYTFASARNIEGQPGQPLVFLSQSFFPVPPTPTQHREVVLASDDAVRLGQPLVAYDPAVTGVLKASSLPRPSWETVARMPSETYDNTWVAARGPTAADQFLTSSQCLGCHDAGSTGLQFDMTDPEPARGRAPEPVAVRHLAVVTDGAGRAGSHLLRPARERDRELSRQCRRHGRDHLSRLPWHPRPAPVRDRPPRRHGRLRALRAPDGQCRALAGRQPVGRPCELRHAGARRRLLHRLPPHGAGRGGQ